MAPIGSLLITGGASGIGAATARRMARHKRVIVTDIDPSGAQRVAEEINTGGGSAVGRRLDVTETRAIVELVAEETAVAPIDSLFCCAGLNIRRRFHDIGPDDWEAMMAVHVKGTFFCAQAVLPGMCEARRGAILTMSSDYAVRGTAVSPVYAAAKTAIYSLTKALAAEFASFNIRVNALGPGPIDTPLLRKGRSEQEWPEVERRLKAGIPMGRLGTADEVASVAEYLLSDRASYMTGQLVHPNGGQVMW